MGQFLSWVVLILPWFLLIPFNPLRVRHFLSVAFFTVLLNTVYFQMAEVWNWWTVKNNLFFLTNISSFTYGMLPVTTILAFYLLYPNPWLFFGGNIFIDAIQAYIVSPFIFEKFGLYELNSMSNSGLFLAIISHLPFIYLYQRWYDSYFKKNHTY